MILSASASPVETVNNPNALQHYALWENRANSVWTLAEACRISLVNQQIDRQNSEWKSILLKSNVLVFLKFCILDLSNWAKIYSQCPFFYGNQTKDL